MGLNIPSKVKTVAWVVLAAAVFGAAGYMITPQSAKSAMSEIDKSLQGAQSKLKASQEKQEQLAGELATR